MLISAANVLFVVFLLFVALVLGLRVTRKIVRSHLHQANYDLTIEQLHAILQSGKISREEFERAKLILLSHRNSVPAEQSQRRAFEVVQAPQTNDARSRGNEKAK